MNIIGPGCLHFGSWEHSEPPVLVDAPDGARVRWRFRNDDWAAVFVYLPDRIEHWIPVQVSDTEFRLRDGYLHGTNLR